ncbi:hypothetical protein B0H19DRAFT_1147833 [Mycena capillaripes]|nr:hypothetical protein B0H19DRAFT_1147833 [Mycena capillaripes]
MLSSCATSTGPRHVLGSIIDFANRRSAVFPPLQDEDFGMTVGPLDLVDIQTDPIPFNEDPPNPFAMSINQGQRFGAVVVTGLPGIGKSGFSRYILSLRVMAGLPTVIVQSIDTLIYYHEGYSTTHPITIDFVDSLPQDTWTIVDCRQSVKTVPEPVQLTPSFLVQLLSPREEGVAWVSKALPVPAFLAMSPWTAEELIAARTVQYDPLVRRTTDDDLRLFVQRYGGSARDAYLYACDQARFSDKVDAALERISAEGINLSFSGQSLPNFDRGSISHTVLSVFPIRTSNGLREMKLGCPSLYVQQLLFKHLEDQGEKERNEVWQLLLANPLGRGLAGNLLDQNYHRVLLETRSWPLYAMHLNPQEKQKNYHVSRDDPTEDATPSAHLVLLDKLSVRADKLDVDLGTPGMAIQHIDPKSVTSLFPNVYYEPISREFPTFDSIVVTAPTKAVVFQATVSGGHGNVAPPGFHFLHTHGIKEVTYIVATPKWRSNINLEFPREIIESATCPKISAIHHLVIDRI